MAPLPPCPAATPGAKETIMSDTTLHDHLADLLPVGMLAHADQANPVVQAIEKLARQKASQPGWEPFHYEKISADELEINGAVPILAGGQKRFPEPHSSVRLTLDEVAAELGLPPAAELADSTQASSATVEAAAASAKPSVQATHLTLTLALPADPAAQARLFDMFKLGSNIHGAMVIAGSLERK
jgi:hypothetical protein